MVNYVTVSEQPQQLRIAIVSSSRRSGGRTYSEALSKVLAAAVLPAESSVLPLWSEIRKQRYGVVEVQFEYNAFGSHLRSALALPVLAFLLRLSTVGVMTLHGVITYDSLLGQRFRQVKWLGYLVSVRVASLFFRLVIVHSEQMRLSLFRYGLSKVAVVPHGSGPTDYKAQGDSRKAILFFGFMRPSKGIDNLISGFLRVHEKRPDARLVIAGSVRSSQEASYLTLLRRQVDNLNLGESVRFEIGYISESDKQNLAANAGLLVLPYTDR
jgi:glycosyltransferase involved in cell wall biosynthesis